MQASSYSSSISSGSSVSPLHPGHAPSSIPAGWQECVSRSTGRTYFWNHVTKKSQWERPTKPAVAAPKSSPEEEKRLATSWTENAKEKDSRSVSSGETKKLTNGDLEKRMGVSSQQQQQQQMEEEEGSKENKMSLLSDYLKQIQSGEATVEELATKYDKQIKTASVAEDRGEKISANGGHSPRSETRTAASPASRVPVLRQMSEERRPVTRDSSDASRGTSLSVDNTPLPTRRVMLGSTGSSSGGVAGGPANRLIARLRGRALKSVTPHQFFSNPSLHSVEETDIDTGQKTTKILYGETDLDQVYKERVLKAESMMNLAPGQDADSSASIIGGRCFKAKSLDPVFKESVPISQLNGHHKIEDDTSLSYHERRFKKSLQNLHIPDWFSNSRFYRNPPGTRQDPPFAVPPNTASATNSLAPATPSLSPRPHQQSRPPVQSARASTASNSPSTISSSQPSASSRLASAAPLNPCANATSQWSAASTASAASEPVPCDRTSKPLSPTSPIFAGKGPGGGPSRGAWSAGVSSEPGDSTAFTVSSNCSHANFNSESGTNPGCRTIHITGV